LTEQEYILSGAIEACVFGLASAEENQEYLEMRKLYPSVVEYANAMEEKLELAHLQNTPVDLPTGIFEKIEQQIKDQREAPVLPFKRNDPVSAKKWQLLKQYGVAAGFALLLGSTVFNFILAGKVKDLQSKVNDLAKTETAKPDAVAAFAFLKESDITPVALYGVGIHAICKCSLFWDKNSKTAYFQIHHLFPPGQEKDYQVWAEVEGKPVSLGILRYNQEKTPIAIPNIPDNATRFTVTLENKGGNKTPNLKEIYLMGQIST
jgi:hypothetical protein